MVRVNNNNITEKKGIFTNEEWNKLYSKQDYKTKRGKTHTLHYLIGRNQSDEKILDHINAKFDKNKTNSLFKEDFKNYSFTPLIMAVMRGNYKIVRKILSCAQKKKILKKQLNLSDKYRWTALHHAAISSKKIYDLLVECHANIHAETINGAKPETLQLLTTKDIPCSSSHVTFASDDFTKAIDEMTKEEIKSYLELEDYRETPYFPPRHLKHLWKISENIDENRTITNLFVLKSYSRYQNEPTKLMIKESPLLTKEDNHRLGLFADQQIPFGAIIGTYSGEFKLNKKEMVYFTQSFSKKTEYLFFPYDAKKRGNVGRFANTGFPNAIPSSVNVQGYKENILISIEEEGISSGEEILWDYGLSYGTLAWGISQFNRKKVRNFFKEGLLKKIVALHKKEEHSPPHHSKEHFILLGTKMKLCYPLNNPGALLDLHFSNTLNVKEWLIVIDEHLFPIFLSWQQQESTVAYRAITMMKFINKLEEKLQAFPQVKEEVNTWVLSKIGNISIIQILEGLSLIEESLDQKKEVDWNALNQTVENYEWSLEEEPPTPINFESTKKTVIDLLHSIPLEKSLESIDYSLTTLFVDEESQGDMYEILLSAKELLLQKRSKYL